MKKTFCILSCLALLLSFAGCGAPSENAVIVDPNAPKAVSPDSPEQNAVPGETEGEQQSSYYYEANGVRIHTYDLAGDVLKKLGEPNGTFEAPSCAYQGMDVFYYYSGFQLTVNELDGGEHVTVIMIVDDTVSIPQGLKIGSSKDTMIELMGEDFSVSEGIYEFVSGSTTLQIQVKDDAVASILYVYTPQQ